MITGLTRFKERFKGFENQYVLIGGTACDLIMESEELSFRATKDLDIVLIVESITTEFVKEFWTFIKEADYEYRSKSNGKPQFYRFYSPKSKEYPYMIELFSRRPDCIKIKEDSLLAPMHIDDELSSLSAILLDDDYYELLKKGQIIIDGIPVLRESCLIPLKAKAWLDLTERKMQGEHIDSKNIRKHKNDVFRLAQLLSPTSRQELVGTIEVDMREFLNRMDKEEADLKSLGIKGVDKKEMLNLLYECYGIKR